MSKYVAYREISASDSFDSVNDPYGWCRTDRRDKNPKKMRRKNEDGTDREDYFLRPDLRAYTSAFFETFGLPMPKAESIYRGNSQDLLFMDDMGLVIRTGPVDVIDLMHPCVTQPLYWMPFDNDRHVISIYAGIQLPSHVADKKNKKDKSGFDKDRHKLVEYMKRSGQLTRDASVDENFGYVDGVLQVLDCEQFFFGSRSSEISAHKKSLFNMHRGAGMPVYQASAMVMQEIYGGHKEYHRYIAAFDYHIPLRSQLNDALTCVNEGDRHEKLTVFYNRCQKLVREPEQCVRHLRDHFNGAQYDQEGEIALYKPWTGDLKDNRVKRMPNGTPRV